MFKKREKKNNTINVVETETPEEKTTSIIQNKPNLLQKKRIPANDLKKDQENLVNDLMNDLHYKSQVTLQNVNDAVRHSEYDTEHSLDAIAIKKRNMEISKAKLEGKIDQNVYMGKDANINYLEKSEKDLSRNKVTGSLGPLRAPTNIRITCRFDYAPGICKDYKETGYCGFGDNCVFMHDRGDYKTGWELEEEWRKEQELKNKLLRQGKTLEDLENDSVDNQEDEDNKDDECPICQNELINPISTKCEHIFCESCALKHYSKSKNCFLCKKPTNGIFNNAEYIIKARNKNKENKEKKNKNYTDFEDNLNTDDYQTTLSKDNMDFLESSNRDFDYIDEFEGVEEKLKKKKNKFKIQNSWLVPSNYREYQ